MYHTTLCESLTVKLWHNSTCILRQTFLHNCWGQAAQWSRVSTLSKLLKGVREWYCIRKPVEWMIRTLCRRMNRHGDANHGHNHDMWPRSPSCSMDDGHIVTESAVTYQIGLRTQQCHEWVFCKLASDRLAWFLCRAKLSLCRFNGVRRWSVGRPSE